MKIVRTDEEICAFLSKAEKNSTRDTSKFPNDSFENGVVATLAWLFGRKPWDGSEPDFTGDPMDA